MFHQFRIHIPYIILSSVFFIMCILIVLYSKELGSIRGWIGDIIVIMLLYSIIRSIASIAVVPLIVSILLVAIGVELLQYVHFAEFMGWQAHSMAQIIFGAVYDTRDIFAYIIGGVSCIFLEKFVSKYYPIR